MINYTTHVSRNQTRSHGWEFVTKIVDSCLLTAQNRHRQMHTSELPPFSDISPTSPVSAVSLPPTDSARRLHSEVERNVQECSPSAALTAVLTHHQPSGNQLCLPPVTAKLCKVSYFLLALVSFSQSVPPSYKHECTMCHIIHTDIELRFYVQLIVKQVISETFFPANFLASTEETKPNTTKANIHPKHKNI